MASGPEVIIKSLFRAMGFDPAQFAASIQAFTTDVYTKLAEFDRRMNVLEAAQLESLQILRRLEARGNYERKSIKLIDIGVGGGHNGTDRDERESGGGNAA